MNDAQASDERRDGSVPGMVPAALAASAAVVAAQVLLPRFFSILLWYHLAFMVVSLAMAGFAAGGVLVRRRAARTQRPGGDIAPTAWLAGASLSVPAALAFLVRLPVDTSNLLDTLVDPLLLLLLIVALSVPFVCLGVVVCSALDAGTARIGRVYAATFVGGALGALVCLGALEFLGTRRAAGVLALLPLLGVRWRGAWLPARGTASPASDGRASVPGDPSLRVRGLTAAAVLGVALLLAVPKSVLPYANRKHFPQVDPSHVLAERSDATSDVIFYENVHYHGLSAPAPHFRGELPLSIAAAIDSWAITFFVRRSGPDDFHPYLDHHSAGFAYTGARPGFSALILGAGGGWDVLGALHAGASHVTAVEINALVVEAATRTWADETARLYEDPRVELHVAEGRRFVENDARRYDRIVLAGVDTFAATQAGAFALAENTLYTVEALDAYIERLADGGILFMTRWWFDPPRQTLRLMLTAAAALEARGVTDPGRRMFVATDALDGRTGNSLFLLKGGADFTPSEIAALAAEAQARGLTPLYAHGMRSHGILVEALDSKDRAAWMDAYPYRVDPTTDDRPFFFENGRLGTLFRTEGNWIHNRLGGQEVLVTTLAALLLLCAPLFAAQRRPRASGASSGASSQREFPGTVPRAPFLLMGLGFLFVELPIMQRLSLPLGHPIHAVAAVLAALLLWSGLGAFLAGRIAPRRAALVPLLASAAVLAFPMGLSSTLVDAMLHWDVVPRVLCAWLLLLPPGLAMGAVFPLAVRACARSPGDVAAAFVWNGAASVVAGPLVMMVAMDQGFTVTLALGASCYALAAASLVQPALAAESSGTMRPAP